MDNYTDNIVKSPAIIIQNETVRYVNDLFIQLTGFNKEDLINKSVFTVCKDLLRFNIDSDLNSEHKEAIIFTKSLEVRFVHIKVAKDGNKQIYYFREKPNSRLEDKFMYLYQLSSANKTGIAIYSFPELTLLKANEMYLDFYDLPYNSQEAAYGKQLQESYEGWSNCPIEGTLNDTMQSGASQEIKEFKHKSLHRGISYWDMIITPIKEYGKVKYIVVNAQEVTDRVLINKSLEEKNKHLKLILDSISDSITLINKEGRYIEVTDSINEKFKNNGRTYKDVYNEIEVYDFEGNVIPLEETVVAKVLRGEKVRNYKSLAIIKGKKVYLDNSGVAIYNNAGEFQLGIIITHDITELIEKENLINEQKKLLEAIVENMADGLSIFNSKGEYVLFNKAAKDMFFPSYEYLGKVGDGYYQAEYYDEEDNIINRDSIPAKRVIRGDKFAAMRMKAVFPDKVLHMSVSGTPIYDGKGDFYLGVLCSRDITESVNRELIIKEKKDQLEIIMENMKEALFIFDKNGNYILVNKAARERVGGSINKLGQTYGFAEYYDINGSKILYKDTPNYLALKGKAVSEKIMMMKTPDRESYINVSGSPIFDDQGNLIYGVVTSRDVTDLIKYEKAIKLQEQQLLKAEIDKRYALEKAVELKDDFLSLISHEFRTPLNVINSAMQAINYFCADNLDERAKKYFKMVQQNTYRLLRLVNNLLDITRANAGRIKLQKKNLDIVFLTRSIIDSVGIYAMQKRISLTFESSFNKKIMGIDDEKYERILLNLLANAVKFTPEGGRITVKMRSKGNFIHMEVKDSGIGIPKDKIGKIFERFEQVDSSFSRQAEGTGIGLSLVKRFIEALGGSIAVKSREGNGSTFSFLIPDELVSEEQNEAAAGDLLNNRLVEVTSVEFSDIYF